MEAVKSDFRKKLQYAGEIVEKLQTLCASDWPAYIEYCEKKTEDFPHDINYKAAVNAIKNLYEV